MFTIIRVRNAEEGAADIADTATTPQEAVVKARLVRGGSFVHIRVDTDSAQYDIDTFCRAFNIAA